MFPARFRGGAALPRIRGNPLLRALTATARPADPIRRHAEAAE